LGVGDGVAGSLHMPGTGESCAFVAEAAWTERGRAVGAKFSQHATPGIELLDRYMAHWIKRGRQ